MMLIVLFPALSYGRGLEQVREVKPEEARWFQRSVYE